VLALANVLKLFADKFSRLGGRSLSFFGVAMRAFDNFFFWHRVSLVEGGLLLDDKFEAKVSRAGRRQRLTHAARCAGAL